MLQQKNHSVTQRSGCGMERRSKGAAIALPVRVKRRQADFATTIWL